MDGAIRNWCTPSEIKREERCSSCIFLRPHKRVMVCAIPGEKVGEVYIPKHTVCREYTGRSNAVCSMVEFS